MARMAGIPARIVTGYKGDSSNALNNYLAVKEKDAHAWVELYMNEHWVRYETTSTASHIEINTVGSENEQTNSPTQSPLAKKINLYLMYAKYQVETWILYYSNIRQKQLLQYAKNNPRFIFIFVISLIALLIITFLIITYLKRPRYSSEALSILQPLLRSLKKKGFVRKKDESLHQYFMRYEKEFPHHPMMIYTLQRIDTLYEEIVYGNYTLKKSKIELKHLVKKISRIKNC
jgi:hypothetical protein